MKEFGWNNAELGEMNFENICRLYSSDKSIIFSQKPPFIRAFYAINGEKKYAVRRNRYESGANFVGASYGCDYFVLKGKSKIKICGNVYNLEAGNHYKIPKCNYEFKVIGNESFNYMAVYDLPKNFTIPK